MAKAKVVLDVTNPDTDAVFTAVKDKLKEKNLPPTAANQVRDANGKLVYVEVNLPENASQKAYDAISNGNGVSAVVVAPDPLVVTSHFGPQGLLDIPVEAAKPAFLLQSSYTGSSNNLMLDYRLQGTNDAGITNTQYYRKYMEFAIDRRTFPYNWITIDPNSGANQPGSIVSNSHTMLTVSFTNTGGRTIDTAMSVDAFNPGMGLKVNGTTVELVNGIVDEDAIMNIATDFDHPRTYNLRFFIDGTGKFYLFSRQIWVGPNDDDHTTVFPYCPDDDQTYEGMFKYLEENNLLA